MPLIRRLTTFATFLVLFASLCAALSILSIGEYVWLFELAVQFIPFILIGGFAVLILLVWTKRTALCIAISIALVFNLVPIFAVKTTAAAEAATGSTQMTIAWFNLFGSRDALTRFAANEASQQRDIVAFTELNRTVTKAELEALFPGMTVHLFTHTGYGVRLPTNMALLSRLPSENTQVFAFPETANRGYMVADINTPSGALRLFAAHPLPPMSPAHMRKRNELLRFVSEDVDQETSFILMGDFNVTPWSPVFRKIPGTRVGNPILGPTWHSGIPGLVLPIDHVMLSDDLQATDYHVGPDFGSDHRPLYATIELPR